MRIAAALSLLLSTACQQQDAGGEALSATPSAGAATSSSATSAASAAATAASHPFSGSWKGAFKAQRVRVSVPKGVKDDSWEADDGKQLAGAGDIELSVDATGAVSGRAKGALGELQIRGLIEKESLRAGVSPARPEQQGGMRGVLVGDGDDGKIDALLKVSSHDGTLARQARVVLTRITP